MIRKTHLFIASAFILGCLWSDAAQAGRLFDHVFCRHRVRAARIACQPVVPCCTPTACCISNKTGTESTGPIAPQKAPEKAPQPIAPDRKEATKPTTKETPKPVIKSEPKPEPPKAPVVTTPPAPKPAEPKAEAPVEKPAPQPPIAQAPAKTEEEKPLPPKETPAPVVKEEPKETPQTEPKPADEPKPRQMDEDNPFNIPPVEKPAAKEPEKTEKKQESAEPFTKNDAARYRLWTDASGTFQVEARFAGYMGDSVRLQKANGKYVRIAITALSSLDRHFVEAISSIAAK